MTDPRKARHPAIRAAKAATVDHAVVALSSGYHARVKPVSAKLLDEIASGVQEPEVPRQYIDSKQREEPNPLDPTYLRQVREANRERGMRITEGLIMFGIELVDPIPPTEEWLPKLQYLERRGAINLESYDFDDALDREFVFKTYIAVSTPDLVYVSMASGLTEAEVDQAVAGFPGPTPRRPDPEGGPAS